MRHLLLLMTTTSYRAAAFLRAAERLGVPVIVGSERAQVLAPETPEGHLTLEFRDPEGSARSIVERASRQPVGAVLAADDDGVELAALAAEALGLTHSPPAAVRAARDKHRMREVLRSAGLPGPRFARLPASLPPEEAGRQAAARVGFPCVLKPLALSASRGVVRADDAASCAAAFARVAGLLARPEVAAAGDPARWVLVEQYLPGAEVALEALLSGGALRELALYDKPDPLEGPFFEETIYVTPSRHQPASRQSAVAAAAAAVDALGLTEGPVHAEMRLEGGRARVIEIAPRSIGGLCSRTLRFADGSSLEELLLRHALDLPVPTFEREAGAAGVMMIPIPRAGILREVRGKEEALRVPGIEDLRLTIPPGGALVPWPEGSRYLGFLFARRPDPAAAEAALREAHRRLAFEIE